jgi:hypothetical protein
MSEVSETETKANRKWPVRLLAALALVVGGGVVYVRTHPLVFNEPLWSHAHCMPQAMGALNQLAYEHYGKFPMPTNGYGDALMMLVAPERLASWSVLTGPGYDSDAYKRWTQSGENVPESECGRVYVQGLSEAGNPDVVLLCDKLPTPGGDHCHFLKRRWAPLGREVCTVGSDRKFIKETDWPAFARNQIKLLVKEGFERADAEALYVEKGKRR